jgi:GPH family glycoside/pentoside/hexuronide:cation symporter
MSESKRRQEISPALKKFFGVGDFGFNLMSNIDTFYASYFFTNIAQFSLGIVSIITTISAVIDTILSCLYGAFLNKIKPAKWGRYRSWLIITPWFVPILYAMQFIKINNGIMGLVFVTIAMITSRIAWNIPYIANISMINIAGKTTKERMMLSSTRMIWTSLGNVIYSYAGPAAVALFTAMLGESNAYAATAFAFSVLMLAGYFAHFKMFKGYEETGPEELERLRKEAEVSNANEKKNKVQIWASIKCNPHLIWLMISCIAKYMVLFLVNGLAIYYFTYVSKNAGLLVTFVFITNLLGILASFISKYIVAKLGARNTVVYCYIFMAAGMIVAYFVYQQTWIVIALMCVVVFALTASNACDTELFAACSIYSSYKTGHDTTGTIMGLLAVPVKVGIILRGILISFSLAIAGFNAEIDAAAASVKLQKGICFGFMIIPAIAILIGAVVLVFGYRLSNEKLNEMKGKLSA